MEEATAGLIEEHVQALKLGLLMAMGALYVAFKSGFFQLPRREADKFPLVYTLGVFVLYLTLSIVIVPLAALGILSYLNGSLIDGNSLSAREESWINLALIFVAAFGLWMYLSYMKPPFNRLIFGRNAFAGFVRAVKDVIIGASTWLIAFPVTLVIGQILAIITLLFFPGPVKEQVAVMYVRLAQSYPGLFWMMVATIVFVVPLVEEILFRGFLQTSLRQFMGPYAAIAAASAIFAVFHFSSSQGVSNVEIIGSLFILSCFLGFLYERQGSLWASVGLHAFFNFISIAFLLYE